MQKIEFKRALIAATPLVLVALLVIEYEHTVKTYIRCNDGNCQSITENLNNILVPNDPTTYEPTTNDTSENQRKKIIKRYERSAAIYGGRIMFLFLRVVYITICIISFTVSYYVIYRLFAYRGKRVIAFILVVMALSAGFGIYLYNNPDKYLIVFIPLFEGRIKNDLNNIKDLMATIDSLCYSSVISLVLATCAILYSPNSNLSPIGLKQISEKMQHLQLILYVGTVVLIVGILITRSVYEWSLAFILRDEQAIKIAESFFSTLLSAEGGFFTLILTSGYLPAALILRRRADSLIGLPEQNLDKEKLLRDYNLTFSFSEFLPRLVAISGPLLAGPVGELFSRLSK